MGSYGGMPVFHNVESTVCCTDLDQQVSEGLLYELMIQAGPVMSVSIPRDRVSGQHRGVGYVEYKSDRDADYSVKIFSDNVYLFGKLVKFNRSNQVRRGAIDIGANLFVNNLDKSVDESLLHSTFCNFGNLVSPPKINTDTKSGKVYAFINYDSFDAADKAIANLNGQMLSGKQISVEYAFKNKRGERYGTAAERFLAHH
ncbi:splicing factor 3B subunit, putative [Entamoeba invadens IP1]|uniref:Splicing factor 3B subunit, putative n=1 Tax=Entamoeba invadens IP1 TaxID=370355 RepID=A0A0A1TYA6_ENTIV|nr:splicing factor 3B subunit, putative [Entamoeba invadens IP1]ELP86502.1 splicing factor 3B subunit, putative [Entamoeba invadens IP1]|eukprot:XP_004185848.1 splicing factor 3B subunit, putative [Entamoeba invadens IP1]